jgi:hypothetical protein
MDNSIELAVSSVLKNPILSVLREINISKIHDNLKTNKELQQIVAVIGAYTKKELGFMCES